MIKGDLEMKTVNSVLEGLADRKNTSVINEGWGKEAPCPKNIDPKKFDALAKRCKQAGYKVTEFEVWKLRGHVTKRINVDLDKQADMAPYIRYVDGKFYTYPRMSADFDDAGVKQLIKFLTDANDLCNFLNKEKFEDYMIADTPED